MDLKYFTLYAVSVKGALTLPTCISIIFEYVTIRHFVAKKISEICKVIFHRFLFDIDIETYEL